MATRRKAAGKAAVPSPGSPDETRPGTPFGPLRFEATLGDTPAAKALALAADLDLDRLPDADGMVRLLLTPDDARRLLERGLPVQLHRAHPVRPLPADRVMSDEQAQTWLEGRLRGVARDGER